MQEKSGRPGQCGDVIRCGMRCSYISLPTHPHNELGHCFGHILNCVGEWAEIHNHVSICVQLNHQIDQAYLTFLAYMRRPGYKAITEVRLAHHYIGADCLASILVLGALSMYHINN